VHEEIGGGGRGGGEVAWEILFFHPLGIRWPFGTEVRRRRMITRVTEDSASRGNRRKPTEAVCTHVIGNFLQIFFMLNYV